MDGAGQELKSSGKARQEMFVWWFTFVVVLFCFSYVCFIFICTVITVEISICSFRIFMPTCDNQLKVCNSLSHDLIQYLIAGFQAWC